MKGEVADRAVRFGLNTCEVHSEHLCDRFVAQIVNNQFVNIHRPSQFDWSMTSPKDYENGPVDMDPSQVSPIPDGSRLPGSPNVGATRSLSDRFGKSIDSRGSSLC
jgi:hypothetical protein